MLHRRIFSDPISNLSKQERGQLASLAGRDEESPQYSHANPVTCQASDKPKRAINNYQLIKTLGSGSMGKVKLGLHNTTGEKVAIKIIPRTYSDGKKHPKNENREVRVVREAAIMSLLNHPNIVKMKEVVVRPSHYYLIMEYVSGGQLLDYIISHGKLKEKHARKFIRQICSVIDYCHQNSIVHRDLKIENILIANDGSIKLIDFGLSNLFSPQSHLSTFCGSLYFAAPELLSAKAYTGPEVDIWSIGVILYVLVCGKVPFDDQNQPALHAKIKRGHTDYPSWLSTDCKHLISRMLVTKPSERATMAEILRHSWISKGYDGPPNNYLPYRVPLQLPLNMDIIRGMTGFELGDEAHIKEELESIIGSEAYQNRTLHIPFKIPNPFGGYLKKNATIPEKPFNSPVISIYYLVQEKLDRERIQQENINSDSSHKSSPISIEQPPNTGHHTAISYESGLAEIRKAAANYFPQIPSNTTTEVNGQSATSAPSRPLMEHKRSYTTTGSVLRRLSQAIKSSRSHHDSTNVEQVDPERHLDIIPEASGSEDNLHEDTPITSTYCAQTDKNEKQDLDSHTLARRKSKLTWFSPHLRKANESAANPSSNEDSRDRTTIYVKPVFLKGLFSVATTSTKKPDAIRTDVIRVLENLSCTWRENFDCFECSKGAWSSQRADPSDSSNTDRTSSSSSTNSTDLQSQEEIISALVSVNTSSKSNLSTTTSEYSKDNTNTKDPRPVKFQISIVKIPWLLGLHGLQFRRLSGHPWEYKNICQKILHKLNL